MVKEIEQGGKGDTTEVLERTLPQFGEKERKQMEEGKRVGSREERKTEY